MACFYKIQTWEERTSVRKVTAAGYKTTNSPRPRRNVSCHGRPDWCSLEGITIAVSLTDDFEKGLQSTDTYFHCLWLPVKFKARTERRESGYDVPRWCSELRTDACWKEDEYSLIKIHTQKHEFLCIVHNRLYRVKLKFLFQITWR